jgi:hypothetical protein
VSEFANQVLDKIRNSEDPEAMMQMVEQFIATKCQEDPQELSGVPVKGS